MESVTVTAAKQQAVELLIQYTESHVESGRFTRGNVSKEADIFLNQIKFQLDCMPEIPSTGLLDADALFDIIDSLLRYLVKHYKVINREISAK